MNITRADIYYPHENEAWEDTKRKAKQFGYSFYSTSIWRVTSERCPFKLSSYFFEVDADGATTAGDLADVPGSSTPVSLNEVFRFKASGFAGDCASTIDVKGASCNVALDAGFEFVAHGNNLRRTEKDVMRRAHMGYLDDMSLPEYNPNPYNLNKENTVKELPKSKADVYYDSSGASWAKIAETAKRKGYRWTSLGTGAWVVHVDDPERSIRDEKDHPVRYNELPEAATETFYDRVMEFVNDPRRSDRNTLYLKLAQEGFFSNATLDDEPGQRRVIAKLLKDDTFCEYGKDKFRKHMGDLLGNPGKRVITISVTVPGDRDASEYEGRSVQSDIARYLGGVGSRGTDNFYREAEVLLVNDETIK